jgi:hypothetical protein
VLEAAAAEDEEAVVAAFLRPRLQRKEERERERRMVKNEGRC